MATLAAPGVSATARSRPDVTDHDLVQAVRAGDDHAFERLYHRYHRRISAYVFGMVHDHGRAEDITQEVFVSALRRMRQTDGPIAFKAWIYEIAKNACIDAFRRARRTEEVSIDAEDGHGLGPADQGKLHAVGASPEAAVEGKQQLEHLQGAFGGLSDAHHQILVMRELEGLSYREIGDRLGMSRPSVESTLFRARRRLTEEYEELRTGERCVRIQEVIDRGAEAGGRLGTRELRRLSSHISHCQPCRRQAVMAGLDAGVVARRAVRGKIAAFLPLPAFLKRRWLGGGGSEAAGSVGSAGAQAAQHAPALAQASMAAAQYGEGTMGGWVKAAAVAAALAAAGLGTGAADRGVAGAKADDDAPVMREASGGGGAGAGGAGAGATAGGATVRPASAAGGSGARGASGGRVVRAAGGGAGGSATSSAGAGGGTTAGGGAGTTGFSGGGGAGGSGGSGGSGADPTSSAAGHGAGGSGGGASSGASKPSGGGGTTSGGAATGGGAAGGGAASGAGSAVAGATAPLAPVTGAVNDVVGGVTSGTTTVVQGTVGAVTGAVSPSSSQPIVKPNLTPPAPKPAPQTPGEAVSSTTDAVGGAVGGRAGDAVKQTGAAVGQGVDQVTTGVANGVGTLLGGGGK